MHINITEFRKREKYINCQQHKEFPLLIWNYNQFCQFDRAWDEYTKIARGLITDLNGNIIARPFPKFFNIDEVEETKLDNLPAEIPQITEKLDGSLGILYRFNNEIYISTRGSFNSEQAIWATEWIQRYFSKDDFIEEYTYLFEIIYPENRIVVDYGQTKSLILLAVIDTETGAEKNFRDEAERIELSCVEIIKGSLEEILKQLPILSSNQEGFVVHYSNGLRIKMKGEEYKRLHRLITGFSSKSIWECLMNNDSLEEIIKDVPDEFHQWVKEKEGEFLGKRDAIIQRVEGVYNLVKNLPTRKDQALIILKDNKDIAGLVFTRLDGYNYIPNLWKTLRPKFELPFKKEI